MTNRTAQARSIPGQALEQKGFRRVKNQKSLYWKLAAGTELTIAQIRTSGTAYKTTDYDPEEVPSCHPQYLTTEAEYQEFEQEEVIPWAEEQAMALVQNKLIHWYK
jgi:hypothetical protein